MAGERTANILKYEVKAMKNAMKAFSDVANISFEKTSKKEKANIKWALLNNKDSNFLHLNNWNDLYDIILKNKKNLQ